MAIPVSTGPEDYLQEGMTDPRVGELQQALRQAGYDIAVDNIYGPKTASAVEDLQRKSGIKVDRIYGPETYGALQKALAPKEPPTMAETTGTPTGTPTGTSTQTGTTAPEGFPEYKPPEFPEYKPAYEQEIKKILDEFANQAPYESPYAAQLQNAVNQYMDLKFEYDPAKDQALKQAQQELTQFVMEEMNARGILSSTITADRVAQEVRKLIPQYEEKAYSRFLDKSNMLYQRANMILGLEETTYQRYQDEEQRKMQMLDLLFRMDDREFERYKDKREQVLTQYRDRYNAEINKWDARRVAISDAWDRTNELGYVDNESAIILGVAPGTLSKSAREQKEDAERRARERAEDYERTLKEIEYRHQLALELEDYRRKYSEEEGVTSQQLANYNQIIQSFLSPENRTTGGDPQKALEWMARLEKADPNAYINLVGKQLRDQLMSDLQTAITTPPEEPEPPRTVTIEQMNATAPAIKDPNQRGDYIVGNLVNAGYDDNMIDAYLAANNLRAIVDESGEVTGYEFIDPDMEVI